MLQVRLRADGDVDVRSLAADEFGRRRWTTAERCSAAYWRAEGCTCTARRAARAVRADDAPLLKAMVAALMTVPAFAEMYADEEPTTAPPGD